MFNSIERRLSAGAREMHDTAKGSIRNPCRRTTAWQLSVASITLFALAFAPITALAGRKPPPPNILFVIMDDVGMDQMELYGYGGDDLVINGRTPQLPTIAAIANEGIAFRNAWAMPACSTSRAVFFTGRYPLRTHVLGALGEYDLANFQVSPFEISLPTLLKQSGYESALFGKFHLGLQGENPFLYSMPSTLGWDYFYGWLDVTGDPSSIDTTAGLGDPTVAPGPYSCGFVPGFDPDSPEGIYGADFGACYTAKGKCQELITSDDVPPGRACRDSGGILDPNNSCQKKMPTAIKNGFQNLSAHYVSPLVITTKSGKVKKIPPTDIRARTFRGTSPVDGAIDWIKRQSRSKPWMASISFASAHTPAMQPPQALLNTDPKVTSSLSCAATGDHKEVVNASQRELTTQMIEALDTELARLMVSIGVASRNRDGSLNYTASRSNTMVVILGDNGTLGNVVNLPFDPKRAKGTAYQTGVWVPLVIAGPLVESPNRMVTQMVNIADLYQLFGEIAGIDVHASVPRQLDSESMLPYLTQTDHPGIRRFNFTQVGTNEQANRAINAPCAISTSCTQIPVSKTVCQDNAGVWYGAESDVPGLPEGGVTYCCEVNQFLYQQAVDALMTPNGCDDPTNPNLCDPAYFNLQPLEAVAVRNDKYKVVRNTFKGDPSPAAFSQAVEPSCDTPQPPDEFYFIDEGNPPVIDIEALNLMDDSGNPPDDSRGDIYEVLAAELDRITNSEIPCPSTASPWSLDGNLDGMVNAQDLTDLDSFADLANGGSSWYDVNLDGNTDNTDARIVFGSLGSDCAPE